jgi:hypothetical protein
MGLSAKRKKYVLDSSPLIKFLADKAMHFQEPKSERPARGRPGRSASEKYMASLFMLQFTNLKELAAESKVPYALMRKWASDPEFKKQVKINYEEFVDDYMKYLVEELDIINTIPGGKVPMDFFYRISAEVRICNPFLQKEILARVSKLKYERPDLVSLLVNVALVLILMRWELASEKKMGRRIKKAEIRELEKFEKEIMKSFRDFIGDELMQMFDKPKITDQDKKRGADLILTLKGIGGPEWR